MVRANQLAYDYIKSRILDGTFRPAQRLVETQLAAEIKVSRNTVKKALLQLSEDKLVEIENNKGASVLSLSIEEIQQYYEIRRSLEILVVRSAAELISEEDIGRMHQIFEEMKLLREQEDFTNYSKRNREFHNVIYEASKKDVAVGVIKNIKNQLVRFQFRTMMVPGRSQHSIEEHKALLEALEAHDQDAAALAIARHIDNVVATIVKYKTLFY